MEAFASERRRRWLARVPDSVLQDILQHGLQVAGDGVALRFGKEWEATLYERPTDIWPLLRQPLPPVTVLRGVDSTMLDRAAVRRWKTIRPADTIIEVAEAGHLLPLERPAETARTILGVLTGARCEDASRNDAQQKIDRQPALRLK